MTISGTKRALLAAILLGLLAALFTTPTHAAEAASAAPVVAPATAADLSAVDFVGNAAIGAVANITYTCSDRTDRWGATFPYGGSHKAWTTLGYRYCIPHDWEHHYSFAKMAWEGGTINLAGSDNTINCSASLIRGVRFNLRGWRPYTGANYNPGSFYVPCTRDTINGEVHNFDKDMSARLFWGPGNGSDRQPRWSTRMTLDRAGMPDAELFHWQRFSP